MSTPDEVRRRFIDAIVRGDLDGVVGCYRPDAVLVAPEGRYEGREQIEEFYRAQLAPFDAELTVLATYDSGDTGVQEWILRATQTDVFSLPDGTAVQPSDKQLSQRGMDVVVLADGQISEHRLYYDQVELMAQLGLLPTGQS
jgi:ketosteroid isomerase-like protein